MTHRFDELFAVVPEDGITVSPDEDGFIARLVVQQGPTPLALAASAGAWGAAAGTVAWWLGESWGMQRLIFGCVLIFGLLWTGLRVGKSFLPVEVGVARGELTFFGERLPKQLVGGVMYERGVLTVRRTDGAEVGAVEGVDAASGAWVVRAVALWLEER